MAAVSVSDSADSSRVGAGTSTDATGRQPRLALNGPRGSALDPGLSAFAGVLLAYVAGMAALATLSPFDFVWSTAHTYSLWIEGRDVALNLALLFPAGFLFSLARRGGGDAYGWRALALGLALSSLLECLQAFLPTRVTSPIDVLTNGLGAWAGAGIHRRLGPWLDRRLQQQLSLHLPLANILYLLVPLCSMEALVAGGWQDWLCALPLTVFMAWIAAGLYRHRLLAAQAPFAWRYALAIGALFAIGYLPMCARSLPLYAAGALTTVAFTRIAIGVETRLPSHERRFVLVTIRRALPWFIAYLVAWSIRSWLAHTPYDAASPDDGEARGLLLLRDFAGFTLLGYLVSELHARAPLASLWVCLRAAALGLALAWLCAWLRSENGSVAHSLASAWLFACAAWVGAIIHRAQLRLVRSWGHSLPPARH